MKHAVIALVLLTSPVNAQIADKESGLAQVEMYGRIYKTINAYAQKIGIDSSYISYCHTKMLLDTRHETDGEIPYGVNYKTISDAKELHTIIVARETFERSYLTLCLADAKRILDAVQPK